MHLPIKIKPPVTVRIMIQIRQIDRTEGNSRLIWTGYQVHHRQTAGEVVEMCSLTIP